MVRPNDTAFCQGYFGGSDGLAGGVGGTAAAIAAVAAGTGMGGTMFVTVTTLVMVTVTKLVTVTKFVSAEAIPHRTARIPANKKSFLRAFIRKGSMRAIVPAGGKRQVPI